MNWRQINQEINAGYISRRKHPTDDLYIYNYTARAQHEWRWNEATMVCRGLIADGHGNVVARPFRKFFSLEQLEGKIPDCEFDVFEKLDGSLGILYESSYGPAIATRGSFDSDQAIWATRMLRMTYPGLELNPSRTHLFEIIYPENRIVVDYGDLSGLFLLGVVDIHSGEDLDLTTIETVFPKVKHYTDFPRVEEMARENHPNREGYVLKFRNGERVKIKLDHYKRMHRLITGMSNRAIWEILANGGTVDLDAAPQSFKLWATSQMAKLTSSFSEVLNTAHSEMPPSHLPRKEQAEIIKQCRYPSVMFAILSGKRPDQQAWKMAKPAKSEFYSVEQ